MSGKLRLSLLGGLQIYQGKTPITGLRTKKAQALLCYLAVTGRTISRPTLAGLLWADTPESNALMNLRKALTELRRHVPEYLITNRQSISFNGDAACWLDVNAFKSTIVKSKGQTANSRAEMVGLENAVDLYKGEFLYGFYVSNAPAFEEWVLNRRVQLRDLALGALGTLATYYSEPGEYETGIEFAKRLLALEPWREEAHRSLMLLYARNGQRSLALAQYEKCRQILEEELVVEPGDDTTVLYEKIRDGEVTILDPGPDVTELGIDAISGKHRVPTNLKPNPIELIGRERELSELEDMVVNRNVRLITMVGPGGIGETRLALEFAEQQQQVAEDPGDSGSTHRQFPDGVYFVPLASLEASELISIAIAESMRYRLDHGEAQLLDYLKPKRLLLVLDNLEHLIEGVGTLSSILRSAPQVYILATSRERLRLHEEQVYPLHGLDYPESALAGRASEYSAGKLFLQTARRQQPGFDPEGSEIVSIGHICHLVEGMPLALELAATWIDTLPIDDIAVEIQHSFDFLATEFRDIPVRHRSLRAVIDISWSQLLPAEQKKFSQLSIFRSGFTREAAEAVTGATIHNLSSLVGKSLLRYENLQGRYYIHELLRQFGAEKLTQNNDEAEKVGDRHSRYYYHWFGDQIIPSKLKAKGQKGVLEQLMVELENARAAWIWGLQHERLRQMMTGLYPIGMYYIWHGGYQEGERTFRTFVENLLEVDESADSNSIVLKINSLIWQAFFVSELGDRSYALQLLQESQQLMDSPQLADVNVLQERAYYLVNYTRADWTQPFAKRLERLAQASAWYREVGHMFGLAYSLTNSALIAIVSGRLKEARKLLDESLIVQKRSGNQLGLAVSYTELGILAFVQNDYVKAKEWLKKSIDVALELDNLQRFTVGSIYLGAVHLYAGQFKQAQQILETCVANSIDLGLKPRHAASLYYLGFSLLNLGEYDQATDSGNAAFSLSQQSNYTEMDVQSITLFGASALAHGNFDEALGHFQDAENERVPGRFVGIVFGEDCGQIGLGTALLQLGRVDEAKEIYGTLLSQAIDNHRLDQLLYALVGNAILLAKLGQVKEALKLYSLATTQPFVGNSRWFADVFGKYVEESSASLPDRKVDEARLHGKSLDLWVTAEELLKTG